MKKYLSVLTIAALALGVSNAQAQTESPSPKKIVKKAAAKKAAQKARLAEGEEKEPDTAGTTAIDFHCELGNKLTVYKSADDDNHIALLWQKHVHRLERVGTTTGAIRFENSKNGLVWIGIPAKSMLLDASKGRQLANECKSAEQAMQAPPA